MAGDKDIYEIPLFAGLDTKSDAKAMRSPGLLIASDVQCDDVGGLQTRGQFDELSPVVNSSIANIRKIVPYGDELVAFTKDKIWSYTAGNGGKWYQRDEYHAVDVTEKSVLQDTQEQYDGDRVEHSGTTFYTWTANTVGTVDVYVAAVDTETGAVKLDPVQLSASGVAARLMVTTNKVMVVWAQGASAYARAYDPTALTYVEVQEGTGGNVPLCDVVQDPNNLDRILVAYADTATKVKVYAVSEAAVWTNLINKVVTAIDGPISIDQEFGGDTYMCIAWNDGTTINVHIADETGSSVASTTPVTATNSTVNQITTTHEVGVGFHTFITSGSSTAPTSVEHTTQYCLIDDNDGTAVSAATEIVQMASLASKSFVHDGQAFAWIVFAAASSGDIVAQLQNTYFLCRSDGLIVGKSSTNIAGSFNATDGHLSGVANTSGNVWKWCGCELRRIPLGEDQQGYAAKGLRDITFEFDSDKARRTTVLGETMYISGSILSQFDGVRVVEVGFHTYPWDLGLGVVSTGRTGVYNYLSSYSWCNAKGECERGTTATIKSLTLTNEQGKINIINLHITNKPNVSQEAWRTIDAAPVGAPFYLITSNDPASVDTENYYIVNDEDANASGFMPDYFTDATLTTKETWPENGGLTLESLASPGGSIVTSTQERILQAGIPGNPHRIVYSKLRGKGEIASFHDSLYIDLPAIGGKITGIAFLNENLVVFKETAIYALPGDGYDNNGGGQNYGPGRLLNSDVGAISQEGIVLTPKGLLFKSSKGWYLLNFGWQATFAGMGATDYDSDVVYNSNVVESQHQVRVITDSRMLVWDYLVDKWFTWALTGVGACVWNGDQHIVNTALDGVVYQDGTAYDSALTDLPLLDIETGWIKMGNLQGYKLIRRILVLGEYRGIHDIQIRISYDYLDTVVDDKTIVVALLNGAGGSMTAGEPLQVQLGPSRPKCQSLKIRVTVRGDLVADRRDIASYALNLTGISLEIAKKQGVYRGLAAVRKA